MTTISLTMDQLCALILAAQDGVLPQQRTARQERNRRYYKACKRRKAAEAAPQAHAPTDSDLGHASCSAETPATQKSHSATHQTHSATHQTHSDALQTVSDAAPSEVSPSPSLPPSPPFPGPLSSAPTHAPPSAAASAHVQGRRKPRQPRQQETNPAAKTAASAAVSGDIGAKAEKPSVKASDPAENADTDEAWLRHLEQSEVFRDIPLREEFRRMVRWSHKRDMRITRTSFLEWLKRYEPPLKLPAEPSSSEAAASAGGFFAGTLADRLPHLFNASSRCCPKPSSLPPKDEGHEQGFDQDPRH